MAKYTVNYACGHSSTVELFGKVSERYRRIDWLETRPCPECERVASLAIAQQTKITYELPDLTGSDKQIAWAEVIRSKAYQFWGCLEPYIGDNDKARALVDNWRLQMDGKTEAAWWIDHRYDMPKSWTDTEPGSNPSAARSAVYRLRELFGPKLNGQ